MCESNKAALLSLSFSMLVTVLKWNGLKLRAETAVWYVIRDWTEHDQSARLSYLPSLLENCLRLGRLPREFILLEIFPSAVFTAQDGSVQASTREMMKELFHYAVPPLVVEDGHGLLYSKSVIPFRPRDARHLLLLAGDNIDEEVCYNYAKIML